MLQTIPTLADVLGIVRENRLAFIFDIKQPPEDQDYAQPFFEICLNEIHDAGIDAQVWFLQTWDRANESINSPEMNWLMELIFNHPRIAKN
jgi:hypothetical protein